LKTPSSELYDLIHSLRQNEKRYFNVFSQTLGGGTKAKNYTRLFAHMSKQPAFDEQNIRHQELDVKHFKRLKHYTTGIVLRSLENFYAESSAEIILYRYLVQADILFHKKQFSLLKKCLAKAIQMVKERGLIQYMVPLVQMAFKSSISLKETGNALNKFSAEQLKKISHDSWRWMELRRLDAMFWNLIHTKDTVGAQERKQFRFIAKSALTVYHNGENGYAIDREAANVLGLCYRFSGDTEKSYQWRKKLIEITSADKKFLYERSAEYVVAIGNLMNLCREMKKNEEVEELFQKANSYVSKLPSKYNHPDLDERFCNLQNSYVSFLYVTCQYAQAIYQGEMLFHKLRKHSNNFMNSIVPVLLRNIVLSAFHTRDFETGNRFYSIWLRQNEPEKTDVLNKKLFGLILFYEQGEKDLTFYRCRSFRYALLKQKKKNFFAKELEKFISGTLLKVSDKQEETEKFRNFLATISQEKRILASARESGLFDYMSWIEKKAKVK